MADGETVEEALKEAKSAMQSWIKTAKSFGDFIPEPGIAKKISHFIQESPILFVKQD